MKQKKYKHNISGMVVDAFQWDGDMDQSKYPDWAAEAVKDGRITFTDSFGANVALINDEFSNCAPCDKWHKTVVFRKGYIVRHANGIMYSMNPIDFKQYYQVVTTNVSI